VRGETGARATYCGGLSSRPLASRPSTGAKSSVRMGLWVALRGGLSRNVPSRLMKVGSLSRPAPRKASAVLESER
jgi:hypothetical protein